ncbi:MAG: nucleoside recognition domain-containing protein [Bacteroidia bacterium]
MVLNYVWIAFFLVGFIVALIRFGMGNNDILPAMLEALFNMAKDSFEIVLGLAGIMTLWMGLMKIGENAGVIRGLSKLVSPFMRRLFPEIPKDHPALGQILMNFSANLLGLDNAATPLGLKAMSTLQELNPDKEKASNSMIMFLVLNASSLTLFPVSVLMYRAQAGAANPTDVFVPIIIATFFSSITGLLLCIFRQRLNILDPVLLGGLAIIFGIIGFMIWHFGSLTREELEVQSKIVSSLFILGIIIFFIAAGLFRKINVFDSFIEGSKDGFLFTMSLLPYVLGMLVSIVIFRTSGAMDFVLQGIELLYVNIASLFTDNPRTDFIPGLPVGLMKPLSGGGARGLMLEAMKTYGADSIPGRLGCIIQGSTETTFYVVAVYFGSVGIKKTRYTLGFGLLADLAGVIAAVVMTNLFFG